MVLVQAPPLVAAEFRLRLPREITESDEAIMEISTLNEGVRLEVDGEGTLIGMTPSGSISGWENAELTAQFVTWAHSDGTGRVFDSSGGFRLPVSGAVRAPDVSWVSKDRLPAKRPRGFLPLCPDVVVEVRSETDRIEALKSKMVDYLDNGARLGLLMDLESRTVWVYRPGRDVEELREVEALDCGPEMPGFILDLKPIW